ncbi:putative uncharacterized protein SERTAD4-AS1 [Artibeus jamaicensis]|uniref:putative uncharacterized protein SERTAD4-AS1 n=1 Tax=Artibeus jamaicensis TaxID=9417 RepID=UPI00235B16D9|nr:putative uncharacterized protein SERTAD4-AS1 [Artibeus jamaicensis]
MTADPARPSLPPSLPSRLRAGGCGSALRGDCGDTAAAPASKRPARATPHLRRPSRTLGKVARAQEAGGEDRRRGAKAWTRRAAAEPSREREREISMQERSIN